MAHAYFHESFSSAVTGESLTVSGEEARHAIKVARLRVGEEVVLLNGRGERVSAEVVTVTPDSFTAKAVSDSENEPEPTPRLVLVQALAKGGRDEMALQAAVEIGVDAIIPWQARRSITKWAPPKIEKQLGRWRTIAREAAKQSIRSRIPEVEEPVSSKQLGERVREGTWLVLEPGASLRLTELDPAAWRDTVGLIVGPEGGIDEAELSALTAAGATPVRLGSNVLRTSTAGPAALAALLTRIGRW